MSTPSKDDGNTSHFVSIGAYAPPDADRLLQALTTAGVQFEIDCDDGIHGSVSKFGTFGGSAKIRVFVDRAQVTKVTHIQEDLFGSDGEKA